MPETSTIADTTSITANKNVRSEKYANTREGRNGQLLEANVEEDEDEITAEDLAPDGGWGWIIAVAMIVVFVSEILFEFKLKQKSQWKIKISLKRRSKEKKVLLRTGVDCRDIVVSIRNASRVVYAIMSPGPSLTDRWR